MDENENFSDGSVSGSLRGKGRNNMSFTLVHTNKRNRLHQQRMNDLVYMMVNMKLTKKEIQKKEPLEFIDIESDDEFSTTSDEHVNNDNENVHQHTDIEASLACDTAGSGPSCNPILAPTNDLVFGSKF
ncbi:hypothetical protein QQ045_027424 [Rhodiola kirilowii]